MKYSFILDVILVSFFELHFLYLKGDMNDIQYYTDLLNYISIQTLGTSNYSITHKSLGN